MYIDMIFINVIFNKFMCKRKTGIKLKLVFKDFNFSTILISTRTP